MTLINDAKLQKRLNNCIKGLTLARIKCLDSAVSLNIVYKFQCESCDCIWEGKIGPVNAKGCPNRQKRKQMKKQMKKQQQQQARNQRKRQKRERKQMKKRQREHEQKHEQKHEPEQTLKQRSEQRCSEARDLLQIEKMYMDELNDKNIRCINHTSTILGAWWYCDKCEYTWQEQFESLIVKLDVTTSPCSQCTYKQQSRDNDTQKPDKNDSDWNLCEHEDFGP